MFNLYKGVYIFFEQLYLYFSIGLYIILLKDKMLFFSFSVQIINKTAEKL